MDFEMVMKLDYETQHFGFHPRIFLDRVYNAFYGNLSAALEELKIHFCTQYDQVISVSSITSNTDALFKELLKELDKAIDKLEYYIDTNIFKIPDRVILPEDQIHMTDPCTKEEDEELDKEIEKLKQSILEERIRKIILKPKLNEQKLVKEAMVAFRDKLSRIKAVLCQVKDTTENMCSTMEKCTEIFNSIKEPPQI